MSEDRIALARRLAEQAKEQVTVPVVDKDKGALSKERMQCPYCERSVQTMYLPDHIRSHNVTLREMMKQRYRIREEFAHLDPELVVSSVESVSKS